MDLYKCHFILWTTKEKTTRKKGTYSIEWEYEWFHDKVIDTRPSLCEKLKIYLTKLVKIRITCYEEELRIITIAFIILMRRRCIVVADCRNTACTVCHVFHASFESDMTMSYLFFYATSCVDTKNWSNFWEWFFESKTWRVSTKPFFFRWKSA